MPYYERKEQVPPSKEKEKKWIMKWAKNWEKKSPLGNWSMTIKKRDLDRVWSDVVEYMENEADGKINYAKCSTALDSGYKSDNGVIMFGVWDAYNDNVIKRLGEEIVELCCPSNVKCIFYKNKYCWDNKINYKFIQRNEYYEDDVKQIRKELDACYLKKVDDSDDEDETKSKVISVQKHFEEQAKKKEAKENVEHIKKYYGEGD